MYCEFIKKEDFYTYTQIKNNVSQKMYGVTEKILNNAGIIYFCTENKPWRMRLNYGMRDLHSVTAWTYIIRGR